MNIEALSPQGYLTVRGENGLRPIVDVDSLLKRHTPDEVLIFLLRYFHGAEEKLKGLLEADSADPSIDETVGVLFRLYMAIALMRKEAMKRDDNEQGTDGSGSLSPWRSRGDRRPGKRQDENDDGEDRIPRERSERSA